MTGALTIVFRHAETLNIGFRVLASVLLSPVLPPSALYIYLLDTQLTARFITARLIIQSTHNFKIYGSTRNIRREGNIWPSAVS